MTEEQAEVCDLVVVGAGLAALHLLSRLPDKLLRGTIVVDSSGGWLAEWSERQARLAAPHMRTPVTQHPHAQPLALKTFVEKRERQQELVPVVKGFSPVPTLDLFRDFCKAKVINRLPQRLRAPRRDTAVRLEPEEGGRGCRVHLASGAVIAARAVIYTPSSRRPVIPGWARQLWGAPGSFGEALAPGTPPAEGSAALEQAASTATAAVAERGPSAAAGVQAHRAAACGSNTGCQPQLLQGRLPAGIATSDCLDLRQLSAELAGKRVVVVGGGMAAGLLAAGAAERGALVTLLCRRPLKPQPFETEVGWWGAKQLNGYRQMEDAASRLRACRRARRQGSVHLPLWRRLTRQAVEGKLTVLEGWEAAEALPLQHQSHQPEGQQEGSAGGGLAGQSRSSAATSPSGWRLTLKRYQPPQAKPAKGPSLFQQAVAATAAGAAAAGPAAENVGPQAASIEADRLHQQPEPQQPKQEQQPQQEPQQQRQDAELAERQLDTQLVWLACGSAYNAATDPVLSRLQQECPALLVGGYAWTDDEHLCWPGAAVYLAGRGAMLSLGPSAGDLPGMRMAADKIAASLQRLDYAEDPVWVEAQRRLLAKLGVSGDPAALGASTCPDGSDSGGTAADGCPAGTRGYAAGYSGSSAAGTCKLRERLAAAVAAAVARVKGVVPLEEEGVPYEDPVTKPSIAKPEHLIDVSDLDPELPRKELQNYKFTDDDFELCVICQLDEPVPLEQVRVLFGEQQLEMWALGQAAAYHLHIPKLYGKVIVKKCRAKVNQKARKVYLLLRKVSDAEWRFLKS